MEPLLIGLTCLSVLLYGCIALGIRIGRHSGHAGEGAQAARGGVGCPGCKLRLPGAGRVCRYCGWIPASSPADRAARVLDDLREIVALHAKQGILDSDTASSLEHALQLQRQRWTQPTASEQRTAATDAVSSTITPSASPLAPAAPVASTAEPIEAILLPIEASEQQSEATSTTTNTELPLPQRVQQYVARRSNLQQQESDAATHVKPSRSWGEVLAAFMEQRHIRWGELVGGLLIVSCSIALVISFWAEIAERPLLKFLLLNGVTAAIFGVGLYADRRWKLQYTSRGLLQIGSLLVPLNFLAIAAFSDGLAAASPLTLAGEAFSIALFGSLLYLAAKVLAPRLPVLYVGAVLLPAIMTLVIRRFIDANSPMEWAVGWGLLLGCLYAGANLWPAFRWRKQRQLPPARAFLLLNLLGMSSFSAAVSLALLLLKTGVPGYTLHTLSPLAALWAWPALAIGWRLNHVSSRRLALLRVGGTSIAVCGGLLLVVVMVAAWPEPRLLIPCAGIAGGVFTLIAILQRTAAAQLPASFCFALTMLLTTLVLQDAVAWNADATEVWAALAEPRTAWTLTAIGLILGCAAFGWHKFLGPAHAAFYLPAWITVGCTSLALSAWHGLGQVPDHGATWLFGLYAITALAVAFVRNHRWAMVCGASLLLISLVQGLGFTYAEQLGLANRWLAPLLFQAALLTTFARLAMRSERGPARQAAATAALHYALAVQAVTACYASWLIVTGELRLVAVALGGLAILGFLQGLLLQRRWLSAAAQWCLGGTAIFAAAMWLDRQAWTTTPTDLWLDPRSLQLQGIVLVLVALGWAFVRQLSAVGATIADEQAATSRPTARFSTLIASRQFGLDVVATWIAAGLLMVLASYAVWPGAMTELTPQTAVLGGTFERVLPPAAGFELFGISHSPAAGWGSWLLLAGVVCAIMQQVRRQPRSWQLYLLMLVVALSSPLLAARWETEVAVASAWCWITSGTALIGSLGLWFRESLVANLRRLHVVKSESLSPHWSTQVEMLLWLLVIIPASILLMRVVSVTLPSANFMDILGRDWASTILYLPLLLPLCAYLHASEPNEALSPRLFGWRQFGTVLLLLLAGAALTLFSQVIFNTLYWRPLIGPEAGSWFARIGPLWSYLTPLVMLTALLVGYAVRQRSALYAYIAGLLAATVTIWSLLGNAAGTTRLTGSEWIELKQWVALTLALFVAGWAGAQHFARRNKVTDARPAVVDPLWENLTFLAGILWGMLTVNAVGIICLNSSYAPAWPTAQFVPAGVSLLATVWVVGGWIYTRRKHQSATARFHSTVISTTILLVIVGVQVVAALAPWNKGRELGVYGLMILFLLAVLLTPMAEFVWLHRDRRTNRLMPRVVAAMSVLFVFMAFFVAMPGWPGDPQWRLRMAAVAACGTLVMWLLAGGRARRGYLYVSAGLAMLAVTLVGDSFPVRWNRYHFYSWLPQMAISLSVTAVVSVFIERAYIQRRGVWPTPCMPHTCFAFAATFCLLIQVIIGLATGLGGRPLDPTPVLTSLVFAMVAISLFSTLWDASTRFAPAGLYLLGVIACGALVSQINLPPRWIIWTGSIALATYAVAVAWLWSRRQGLLNLLRDLRVPVDQRQPMSQRWIIGATATLTAVVIVLGLGVILTEAEPSMRIISAKAILAQALAIGLLARGERRSQLQIAALLLGVLGGVAIGWALLEPGLTAHVLNYVVVLFAVLVLACGLYGVGLSKLLRRENEWTAAAVRAVPGLAVAAIATLLLILGLEVGNYQIHGHVPILPAAVWTVAAALGAMAGFALIAAVVPGRDPLQLPEHKRSLYVYAAETCLGLLLLHLRVTADWLFAGPLTQYWTILVVLLAFAGVLLSEVFRRQQRRVLAEPLERTGALLPLLPVIGYWLAPGAVHFSLVMLAVGSVYVALSVLRKSFLFGAMAATAINGGLWFFLHHNGGTGLLEHPQLWFIPPALCVLVAAYLNRTQLTAAQMAGIRYGCATMIYVSSTLDIVLNGVATSVWLPLVLGALSLAGIFTGILLRVRGFLYLGTGFLGLALFAIIWHAAVDLEQTWIWAVCGILTGILIIALFAVFEKKRQQLLAIAHQLKEWDA